MAAYTRAMPSDIRKGLKMSMMNLLLYPFANKNDRMRIRITIDARNMPQVRIFSINGSWEQSFLKGRLVYRGRAMHGCLTPKVLDAKRKTFPSFSQEQARTSNSGFLRRIPPYLVLVRTRYSPPKHLGDPPPSLCLGITMTFSALICWRKIL